MSTVLTHPLENQDAFMTETEIVPGSIDPESSLAPVPYSFSMQNACAIWTGTNGVYIKTDSPTRLHIN